MKLIGTVHIDIEGQKRLEHLLYRIKPNTISVECPKGFNEEEARKLFMIDKENISERINQAIPPSSFKKIMLELAETKGYELITSLDYCRKTGCKFNFIDHPSAYVPVFLEPSYYDDLRKYFEEEVRSEPFEKENIPYGKYRKIIINYFDKAYYDAQIIYEICKGMPQSSCELIVKDTKPLSREGFEEAREQFMADEISLLRPELHIGGMTHIFEGFESGVTPLYARLKGIANEKIRLCEESLD